MNTQTDMQAFEKYYKPVYFEKGIELPYPIVLVIQKPEFLKAMETTINQKNESKG